VKSYLWARIKQALGLGMGDKWLWEHIPDMQMGMYVRLREAIYHHNVQASNEYSPSMDKKLKDEAGFIAGEIGNVVAYSMGKEIGASSGNKAILEELEQYGGSVAENPEMTTHLTEEQIKRAEKYGIIYYLMMNKNSLEVIAQRTGIPLETVSAALNDDLWVVGYDNT